MNHCLAAIVGCVLISHAQAQSTLPLLVTNQGLRQGLRLEGLRYPGEFAGVAGDKKVHVPIDQIVRWGQPADLRSETCVLLRDGGWLAISPDRPWRLDQEALVVSELQAIRVPRAAIASIVLGHIRDPLRKSQRFRQYAEGDAHSDVCWTQYNDPRVGHIVTADRQQVVLDERSEAQVLETGRFAALSLAWPEGSSGAPGRPVARHRDGLCVGLADGSRLWAKQVDTQSEHVEVTVPQGNWSVNCSRNPQAPRGVVFLQAWSHQQLYISDLRPGGYRHIPFLADPMSVVWNGHVLDAEMRMSGRAFLRGVGVPSASRLAFAIPDGYRYFAADIGIDDQAEQGGSVEFRILLLRSGAWQTAHASGVIRGGDSPQAVRITLDDATAVALVVDYADQGDVLDFADWGDARFER